MPTRKNNRAAKQLAAANRQSYVGLALGFALFALIITPAFLIIPTGSPLAMVQAQVVRGDKIESAATTTSNTDTRSMTVLSNSIAATAPSNTPPHPGQITPKTFRVGEVSVTVRPRMAPADSNSLSETIVRGGRKYLNLSFAKLSAFAFLITPEIENVTDNTDGLNTDDLAVAAPKTRAQVPASVQAYGERLVAITGFMLPVRVADGFTSDFLLLRNQSACCYGKIPRINEWVIVRMAGQGVKPIMDVPVTALGTFHVGEMREGGHLVGIYQLDCDQLLPTQ